MFCSVNDSACLDISVWGLGTDAIDLPAASKNIPKAFSAWSMVFSAISRNSAGTSSFGSIMPSSSDLDGALSHFSERRQCLPRPALEISVFLAASTLVVGRGYGQSLDQGQC